MRQIERRIVALETYQADTNEYPGTVSEWLLWEDGGKVPERARLYFEERRAIADAETAKVMADFED